jgi:signal peptidase I
MKTSTYRAINNLSINPPKVYSKQVMLNTFFKRHPLIKDLSSIALFIVFVFIGTLLINSFVFRSFSVVGPSMENTLFTGDRLIINRLPITWDQLQGKQYSPDRGQVIVFKNPKYVSGANDEYIVKRVIAFEGERVVLKDGHYTVFNSQYPDGFDPDTAFNGEPGSFTTGETDTSVPKGEIFVSGDHRYGNYSYDSRNGLGTIPLYDIVGPVAIRILPLDKIRTF